MNNILSITLVMMMICAASLSHLDDTDKAKLTRIINETEKLLRETQGNEEITQIPHGGCHRNCSKMCLCSAEKALHIFRSKVPKVSNLLRLLQDYTRKPKDDNCQLNTNRQCHLREFLTRVADCARRELEINPKT
ncbi:uncharacterized protein LOC144406327 [Gasterosteus aculeatus]